MTDIYILYLADICCRILKKASLFVFLDALLADLQNTSKRTLPSANVAAADDFPPPPAGMPPPIPPAPTSYAPTPTPKKVNSGPPPAVMPKPSRSSKPKPLKLPAVKSDDIDGSQPQFARNLSELEGLLNDLDQATTISKRHNSSEGTLKNVYCLKSTTKTS